MEKSPLLTLAAALVLTAGALGTNVSGAQDVSPPTGSPATGNLLIDAHAAQLAGRWPEVIKLAREALTKIGRRPNETYNAHQLLYAASLATSDRAEEREALKGMIASGFLQPDGRATLVKRLEVLEAPAPAQ